MKQFFFLDNSGNLKTSIQLKGDIVIAYSLRLWKSDDKVLDLVEELRGSCFNDSCKKISYSISKTLDRNFTYFIEVDANISTIKSNSDYSIKLTVGQESNDGIDQLLGEEEISGSVSFKDGGHFSKLGVSLCRNELHVMAS